MLATAVLLAATAPALAANDLPEGVEQLLTCAHTYSMRSDELSEAGDADGALELYNMGDALLWQARTSLEAAGYSPEQVDNIDMNSALMTGFNYGAGMGEEMLETCFMAWDSP
jgi:hypothetical protein